MDDEERYTRITLRIPKDLHVKLQESSDHTSKSMNAEIIGRLAQSFEDHPVQSAAGSTLVLSALERLEAQLIAAEFSLDGARGLGLVMAQALTDAYPLTKAVIDSAPEAYRSNRESLDTGMRAARRFVDQYEPRSISDSLRGLARINELVSRGGARKSSSQSIASDAKAEEAYRRHQLNTVDNIKHRIDEFDIPGPSEK